MIADLRYAVRQLVRSPGFTVSAVLTLGLGIGACTAAYSLARGLLWRPLPFAEPHNIVVLHGANPSRGITDAELSYADLRDLREQARSVGSLAAMTPRRTTVGFPEGAELVGAWSVDPSLFQVFGVPAAVGRTLRPSDAERTAPPVVVLSYGYWTRRFGRSEALLGRTLAINGQPHEVIGVMPATFQLARADLWLPLVPDPSEARSERYFLALGRLRGGVSIDAARAELAAGAQRLESAYPVTNRGWGIELNGYRDDVVDAGSRRALGLLLAAVGLVLVIACANVAGLLLARGANRSRELAVRAAVGASRRRLIRQALVEAGVLAVAGAGLGLMLATWSNELLLATLPIEDLPVWLDTRLDWSSLAVTVAVAAGSVFLFGLLPAVRASRPDVVDTLRGGASAPAHSRGRAALVVGQVGLAVVLLAAAALFGQSFLAARRGGLGFDDRAMLSARVYFGALSHRPDRTVWMQRALDVVRAVPGVGAAAFTGAIPGDDGGDHRSLAVRGSEVLPGEEPIVTLVTSSDGFLDALAIEPTEGRWFTAAEGGNASTSLAVAGAGLARRLWPDGNAVGQQVRVLPDTAWLTVIGVVPDLQYEEFGEDGVADRLQLHIPYAREPWRAGALLVRGTVPPAALAEPVRRAAAAVHADVPVFDVLTMTQVRSYTTAGNRIWALLFGTLGVQALLMTAVGLYGLLAYGVAQRRREIGVRVALGARPSLVVRLVVGRALGLTALGLTLGLGGAVVTAQVLRGLLWGVTGSTAPIALVALLLITTALLAALLPARRAAQVDPMVALRAE